MDSDSDELGSSAVLLDLPKPTDTQVDAYRAGIKQMSKWTGMHGFPGDPSLARINRRSRRHVQPNQYKGVLAVTRAYGRIRSYEAVFRDKGEQRSVGTFATAQEAARTRDACARKLYGPTAPLNYPTAVEMQRRHAAIDSLSSLGLKLSQSGDSSALLSAHSSSSRDSGSHHNAKKGRKLSAATVGRPRGGSRRQCVLAGLEGDAPTDTASETSHTAGDEDSQSSKVRGLYFQHTYARACEGVCLRLHITLTGHILQSKPQCIVCVFKL